jgi:hypothetical protein
MTLAASFLNVEIGTDEVIVNERLTKSIALPKSKTQNHHDHHHHHPQVLGN